MLELINVSADDGHDDQPADLFSTARPFETSTPGHSGYMGTMAARLVECGFTGEVDSVLGQSTARSSRIPSIPNAFVRDLGSEWLITKSYFKLHPTGRYVHR
jgi:hypothetical protein